MRYVFLLAVFAVAFFAVYHAEAGDVPIKAINLEKLNTAADEEDPCPTPDGLSLLFAKKTKKHYDLYLSKRTSATAAFGAGTPFLFDRAADVRAPFAFQGKYYFATNEVPDEKFEKLKNFDLMVQIGKQRAERIITNDINTKDDETYPWIALGGKEFYFTRKTADGWKLFVVAGAVPGKAQPKEVGFPADFIRATLAGAGLTMYLQGPLEDGKVGIYRSKRDKAGAAWSKPMPVAALNHPDSKRGDLQPALSADGARLYFVSDRPGGKGGLDIWYVLTSQLK